MPVSASEIERMESRDGSKKKASRRRHAEACRVEAVQHCPRAREVDPKKTIKECAKELGASEKNLDDWVVKYEAAGKAGRGRTEEQRALDEANRRIGEPGTGSEFPRKASAFFARNQARASGAGRCWRGGRATT